MSDGGRWVWEEGWGNRGGGVQKGNRWMRHLFWVLVMKLKGQERRKQTDPFDRSQHYLEWFTSDPLVDGDTMR